MTTFAPGSSVMPFESTNRASRAASALTQVSDDYSYTETFFDKLFLIFDELGRFSPPNSILVFIQFFISFYQYYLASFLPFLPKKWHFFEYPDKILRFLNYPVDFGLGDFSVFKTGAVSIFMLILNFLIIIYLLIILIYFHINKMFPRYHAFISRFIVSILIPIILAPSCYNIGFSFNCIFSEQTVYFDSNITNANNNSVINDNEFSNVDDSFKPFYITSTILGIIFYLILIFIYYIDIMFRSSTPYLENTVLSMWDSYPVFLCVFGTNVAILFSRLIKRLPSWSYILMNVCCVFYNVFVLYQMFFFPMIKKYMNVVLSIIISSCIVSSFLQLLPISAFYRLLIPFCFVFVFIPVFIVLFRLLRKNIVSKNLEDIDISKENNSLRYMRLSIADKCTDFVSFNWIKQIIKIGKNSILCQASQMVSFFPSEFRILKVCIMHLSTKNDLKMHQRFLFNKLRLVYILRQSNTSKQLNEDLDRISKSTNQSISYFQQFLIRIIDDRQELTIDRLNFLSQINRSTNSLCHEAISRYPNNPKLLLLFSQYVIECQAEFKKGIQFFHESQMIERGKRDTVDFAFQSMVNLFPSYLYKRILDLKGNIILNRRRSKSGSSMSTDSTSNEKNITDFDYSDQYLSNVIDNPRLRLSLRKAVNNMNSTGIIFLSIWSIFRFLLAIVICLVTYEYSSNFLVERKINYQNIVQIGRVRKFIDLVFLKTAKLWAISLGISPKIEMITSSLGPGITLNDYHNSTMGPHYALFSDSIDSIRSVEKLGKLLVEIKYEGSMDITDKTTSEFVQMQNLSFCNSKRKTIVQTATSARYFTLYVLNRAIQATKLNETYVDPIDWKDDETICEIILNNHNVINILTDQSTVLINQEKDLSNSVEKRINLFFSISIPIVFLVFIIPFIIGYIKMNSEFQQIFDVLKLLPIDIYKKASQPIAIFRVDNDQNQVAISTIESKRYQKYLIIIPAIIGTLIVACELIVIYILIKDSNSKFYSIVRWLEIGSGRSPLVIETITNAIYSNIFGYLGDTNYATLLNHLELVFNYSQQLLYQHKSLIWGSEGSTSCNNFSKRLDSLHFVNTCSINTQNDYFHHNYRCQSLDQQIMTFNKFAKDLYLTVLYAINNDNSQYNPEDININFMNILNGYEMINLHYLGITYMLPRLEAAQEILDEGINLKIEQLNKYSLLVAMLYLALAIIIFCMNLMIIRKLNDDYNIVRILIARLPPLSVVRNQQLVELITGNSSAKYDKKLTPIMINVRYCSSPMISFDNKLKIKLINTTASEVFGFTKEQLFQADLSLIFNSENYSLIQQKVRQNEENYATSTTSNNNNTSNTNNDEFSNEKIALLSILLNNDDDINLNNNNNQESDEKVDLFNNPFKLLTVGTKDDGVKLIFSAILTYFPKPDDSYVLILKDITQLFINDDEIKEAKQKAISLMNQVLPRAMIQDGELSENVSFSIKQVSVISIKIINFNDSIPHISSVQAVRNMSVLFTHFDMQLINYPNLTKTSMISGLYQAVGGLFDQNSIRKFSTNKIEMNQLNLNENQNSNKNQATDVGNVNNGINEKNSNMKLKEIINESLNNINEGINSTRNNNNENGKGSVNSNKVNIIEDSKQDENNSEDASESISINDTIDSSENTSENNNNNNNGTSNVKNIVNDNTNENVNNNNKNTSNDNTNENVNSNNENASKDNSIENINNNDENTNKDNTNENINSNSKNTSNNNTKENINNNNENANKDMNNNNESASNDNTNENINNNNENANKNNTNKDINNNNESASNDNTNENINNNNVYKDQIRHVLSRKSIYNIKSLNPRKDVNFSNIVLDSIYFAFDCFRAVEFFNSSNGTNFVLGIGINIGGPVTTGTIGHEHLQFELVGGAIKESYIVCNAAEDSMIVITNEAYECVKNLEETQKNIIFEKYKKVNLLHSIKTDTFTVRPTENLFPSAQFDEMNQNPQIIEEEEEDLDDKINPNSAEMNTNSFSQIEIEQLDQIDQQMQNPDDLISD